MTYVVALAVGAVVCLVAYVAVDRWGFPLDRWASHVRVLVGLVVGGVIVAAVVAAWWYLARDTCPAIDAAGFGC